MSFKKNSYYKTFSTKVPDNAMTDFSNEVSKLNFDYLKVANYFTYKINLFFLTFFTYLNPFQPSVAFHRETSHLICWVNQMTGLCTLITILDCNGGIPEKCDLGFGTSTGGTPGSGTTKCLGGTQDSQSQTGKPGR